MRSFVKKMFYLSILLISCLTLFISETFADTLLYGVELESGYRNTRVHTDATYIYCYPMASCPGSNWRSTFFDDHVVNDKEVTITTIPYPYSPFLNTRCEKETDLHNYNIYGGGCVGFDKIRNN